jgi:hypothetical protein
VSATPGATNEYSTGGTGSHEAFNGDSGPAQRGSGPAWRGGGRPSITLNRGLGRFVFGGASIAALLLVVAEFTTLYQVHLATKLIPIQSVSAGTHNSYAMIPIAVLAALLGFVAWRSGNRLALLGIGVLGVVALVIALAHDLPDTHAVGLADNNRVSATTTPQAGLYVETLGAVLLIATSGLAFMLAGAPGRSRRGGGSRGGGSRGGGSRGGGAAVSNRGAGPRRSGPT